MKKFLLPESGKFYKANLHCHTNVSDGALSPEEVKKLYKEHGYSIVAYTDHNVLVPHPELADEDFLPMNGFEVDVNKHTSNDFCQIKTCHLCYVALKPDNVTQVCYHRSDYTWGNATEMRKYVKFDENEPDYVRYHTHECINDMIKRGRDNGFFMTYNHPSWSLENYEDYIGYEGMHAMEICNNGCLVSGYNDYNEKEYDDLLRAGKRIFCIAADDNHGTREACGAYIMVKADKLEYETIGNALLAGNFYSSMGPEIHELWYEDGKIHITCSDAKRILLHTGNRYLDRRYAEEGKPLTSAVFDVKPEFIYARITVEGKDGLNANTNAYFMDELLK